MKKTRNGPNHAGSPGDGASDRYLKLPQVQYIQRATDVESALARILIPVELYHTDFAEKDPDHSAVSAGFWEHHGKVLDDKKLKRTQKKIPKDLFQKLVSCLTRKFLIPIKYRNCNFFSVS